MTASARASASDFWDAVRNPGSGSAHTHALAATQALAANQGALALEQAELAITACASCGNAHVLRGRALAALGRPGEALAEFEHAIAGDVAALDEDPDAEIAAGSALRVARPDFAVAVLRRMLGRDLQPEARRRAMTMLADALQAQGTESLAQAITTYRDASADGDEDAGARVGLALALFRQGQSDPALALARRSDAGESERAINARALPPAELAARSALLHMARGDRTAAEQGWRSAAEGDNPWSEQARSALANLPAASKRAPSPRSHK